MRKYKHTHTQSQEDALWCVCRVAVCVWHTEWAKEMGKKTKWYGSLSVCDEKDNDGKTHGSGAHRWNNCRKFVNGK